MGLQKLPINLKIETLTLTLKKINEKEVKNLKKRSILIPQCIYKTMFVIVKTQERLSQRKVSFLKMSSDDIWPNMSY